MDLDIRVVEGLAEKIAEAGNRGIREFREYIKRPIRERHKKDPYYKDECDWSLDFGADSIAMNVVLLASLLVFNKETAKEEFIKLSGEFWYNKTTERYSDIVELGERVYRLLISGQSITDVREYYRGVKI